MHASRHTPVHSCYKNRRIRDRGNISLIYRRSLSAENPNKLLNLKIQFCLTVISAIMRLNRKIIHKKQGRKSGLDRENKLHVRDLAGEPCSNVTDSDGVYFFIADKISDTGFIMKTALNLMNKRCNAFCFFGKYKDIWHKTVEDIFDLWSKGMLYVQQILF